MSIIYDALKKSGDNPERERKTVLSADSPLPSTPKLQKPFDKKKLLLPIVFVLIIGFFGYPIVTGKNNHKGNHSKYSSAAKSSGTKHESRPAPAPVVKNYSSSSLALEGIIYDEAKPIAIINGKVVKPGETINDATVESISATKVILRKNGNTQELSM